MKASYKKGRLNVVADCLSIIYKGKTKTDDAGLDDEGRKQKIQRRRSKSREMAKSEVRICLKAGNQKKIYNGIIRRMYTLG